MNRISRIICATLVGTAAMATLTPGTAFAGTIGASCAVGNITAIPGHVLLTSLHGELRKWPDNGTPTTLAPDGSVADRWRLDVLGVKDSSPAAPGGHLLPFVRVDPFTYDVTATNAAVWPITVTFTHHNIRPDLTTYQDPPRTVTIGQDGLPCTVVAAPPTTTTTTVPTATTTTTVAATTTTASVLGGVTGTPGVTVPAGGLPETGGRYTGAIVALATLLVGMGWLLTRWGRAIRNVSR